MASDCSGSRGNDGCVVVTNEGFLHGVACAQVHIRADIWLTTVFGKELGKVPDWVLEARTTLLSYINLKLRRQPTSRRTNLLEGTSRPCDRNGLV